MTRRTDTLTRALNDLTATMPLFPDAERRMMDARPAQAGAASYDGTPGGRSTSSSVETLAMQKDPTARDRQAMDRALRMLEAAATELLRLSQSWQGRAPTGKDQAEVGRLNQDDPTCQHCTPMRKPGNVKLVHAKGDVAGNLDQAMGLCRWCYDYVRTAGRLPAPADVHRHDDGLKVMVRA